MNKNDTLYGLEDQERLDLDPDDVIDRVIDDAASFAGESFDAIAERLDWPLKVKVYKRMSLGGVDLTLTIATTALERTLDDLDENYGDPDGDYSDPTEAMKSAARAFARAVLADYVPWACEPTGEVIEYTREQVRAQSEASHNPS